MAILPRGVVLFCTVAAAVVCAPCEAQAKEREFDIPSQAANRAILEFSRQASVQVVAPGRQLRKLRTKRVKGRYDVAVALRLMLDGTGIRVISFRNNTITLGLADNAPLAGAARRQSTKPQAREGAQSAAAKSALPVAPQEPPRPILVTGSRLKIDSLDTPVPVTMIDSQMAEDFGHNNVSEMVGIIPQNIATQSDATSGTRLSADVGSSYANLRGLNPTFGTRTLTLVNSRRFVPTSDGGQVDLNLIPSILVQRIESVTGGASAVYGSDAVAGVVNVILDNQFEGLKGNFSFGQTSRGDGRSIYGALGYGVHLGGSRGHLALGAEVQDNRGIAQCAEVRDWCAEGWTVFTNAATIAPGQPNIPGNVSGHDVPGSAGYGLPNYVLGPAGALVYNSPTGAIRNFQQSERWVSGESFSANHPRVDPPFAAVDKAFTADGRSLVDYDPGLFGPKSVGGLAQGGDNDSVYGDQVLQTPMERYTTYASLEYELSDAIKLYSELSFALRKSHGQSFTAATRSTMAIKADNAFLPQEAVDLLDGANFSLGKDVDRELQNIVSGDARVFRGVLGLGGGLFADWSWDAYYQIGENKRKSSIRYARYNDAFVMAIDAVRDPEDPSKIICRPLSDADLAPFDPSYRAELQALNDRCVPLNLFGMGHMDPAAVAFAWRNVREDFTYRQQVVSGSAQGTLLSGWGAGPVSLAAGFEFRDERGEVTHGGVDASNYAFSFGLDYAGKIRILEGFLETRVPVFTGSALGDYLELNGAIRYTRNISTDTVSNMSKTVDADSWKLGLVYDLTEGVRLRATQSRDIRAAGFRELFRKTAPTDEGTAQGRVDNPNIAGPNKSDATPIFTGGNFSLRPERADTTTVGLVLKPSFLPNLKVAFDWYQIRLKDAIANLNGQRVTDLCIDFDVLCDRLTFASPTDIARVDAGQANIGKIDVRGFDLDASYRLDAASLQQDLKGSLKLRLLLNHQYDFVVLQSPDVPAVDYAGQSGPVIEGGDFHPTPKWIWQAIASYDLGPFNSTIGIRHIGSGALSKDWIGPDDPRYDPTLPNTVSSNRVDGVTYISLAMSYAFALEAAGEGETPQRRLELYTSIENLFDRDPPVAPGGGVVIGATAYPTNPVFFDTYGMRWKVGARVSF